MEPVSYFSLLRSKQIIRLGLALSLALLAAWTLGVVLEPSRRPEAAVRRYLTELESGFSEAALSLLTPEAESRWRDFVIFQRNNRYRVLSVAVGSTSVLDGLRGQGFWRPTHATLVVEVTELSGLQWRSSTLVPLRWEQGRWRLERPPFASD